MPIHGQCTGCGAVEVLLDIVVGTQDLTFMGEDPKYPFGPTCEVCSDKPLGFRSATAPANWESGNTFGPINLE